MQHSKVIISALYFIYRTLLPSTVIAASIISIPFEWAIKGRMDVPGAIFWLVISLPFAWWSRRCLAGFNTQGSDERLLTWALSPNKNRYFLVYSLLVYFLLSAMWAWCFGVFEQVWFKLTNEQTMIFVLIFGLIAYFPPVAATMRLGLNQHKARLNEA